MSEQTRAVAVAEQPAIEPDMNTTETRHDPVVDDAAVAAAIERLAAEFPQPAAREPAEPDEVTIAQAAELMGTRVNWIQTLVRRGTLPTREGLISRAAVIEWRDYGRRKVVLANMRVASAARWSKRREPELPSAAATPSPEPTQAAEPAGAALLDEFTAATRRYLRAHACWQKSQRVADDDRAACRLAEQEMATARERLAEALAGLAKGG